MVKLLLLVLVTLLLLYLGFKEESKDPSTKSTHRVQIQKTAEEDFKKIEGQKRLKTQKEHNREEFERVLKEKEVIYNTEEEDEAEEEIAEDERAEDYYKKSDVPSQKNLVGGADIDWIEPDKAEKTGGKFGLPPPIF